MKLEELEAFLAVVDQGSSLAAARALGRRRATLQRQVTRLEEGLGITLLVRTSRGSEVTRVGEAFATRARQLLDEARSLAAFAREGRGAPLLRLGVPPGSPPQLYLVMTQFLRAQLPDCRFAYRVCGPGEALDDPTIDIFAQFRDHLQSAHHRTFVNMRYPIRLLGSPAYLALHGTPQSVDDLVDHELLAWLGYRPDRATLWPRVDGAPFSVQPRIVSDDTHVLRKLASQGLGLALVADAPQMHDKTMGEDLVPVLDGIVGEQGALRIVVPERAAESREVRAVVDAVRALGAEELDFPTM